jgi:hypothetical protein
VVDVSFTPSFGRFLAFSDFAIVIGAQRRF